MEELSKRRRCGASLIMTAARRTLAVMAIGAGLCWSGFANAQQQSVVAVPTAWRLQVYVPNLVNTYFTGAPCPNGELAFDANATADDKNRYWSMIMTAKVSQQPVEVLFVQSGTKCYINSFLLLER